MGSSKRAPRPADPRVTAGAQTASNIGTAITQQTLNNVNQRTPFGDLTFETTGFTPFTDPLTGETFQIPNTTATQTLSPAQQAILEQNNRADLNLAQLGADQTGRIGGLLEGSINTSNLPARGDANSIRQANFQTVGNGPELQTGFGRAGRIQSGFGNGGNIQRSIADGGNITGSIANAGQVQTGFGSGGNIQRSIADGGQVQSGFGGGGDITRTYGTDFSQDRQKVEEALFSRINPQLDRDRAALEARLASQGIRIGSKAYESATRDFALQSNDARFGAILGAGEEQSRLAGLEAQRSAFENSAQNQAFGQNQALANFANQAQAQRFGQNSNQAAFQNSAQNQAFGQNQALASFGNSAQAQRFGQNQAISDFANQAQAQRFGQNSNQAAFQNSAQSQAFGQNQALADFRNNAQAQRFGQQATRADFSNNALQQGFGNQVQAAGVNNQVATAQTNADIARFDAANSSRNQALEEQFALANQPLNQINSLLSGAQIQNPNFINANTPQLANTDFAGIQANFDNLRNQQFQAQQARTGNLLGGAIGFGTSLLSDRRTKQNIKKIGETDDGQNIYKYRYKMGGPMQIGLMAQEVEKKKPDAVTNVGGIKMVDYGKALR